MDELVNQVSQRTGLPPDQARQAVLAVVDALKSKLPGPIASQIDGVLGGGQAKPGDIAGQALGGLGGMFGGGGSNS